MILGIGSKLGLRLAVRGCCRKPNTENQKPKKGFTLIEIMLTVTILAIGIVGVLRGYAVAVNALETGRYSIDAFCLLKEKLSEVEQKAIEEKGLSPGINEGQFENRYEGFEWQLEVTALDLGIEDLKEYLNEVKITVINEQVKPVRRFSLVTYMEGYVENKK